MSVYTNDIDTLRQMISQSMPQLLNSGITIVSVFISMLILSIPLTIVTMIMVGIMVFCSKKSAGQKAGHILQNKQKDLGTVNGYIEEMMNGQKVVKVFCHEEENMQNFKKLNDELYISADRSKYICQLLRTDQCTDWKYQLCNLCDRRRCAGTLEKSEDLRLEDCEFPDI